MKKRKMIVILMFLMFGLGLMTNCDWFKNPAGPDPEPLKYVVVGEVIYKRELPVQCEECAELVRVVIEAQGKISISYRMEKVGPQKWRVYVPDKIVVNYPSSQSGLRLEEHIVYIIDPKLFDGRSDYSPYTGFGIYMFDGQKITRTEPYGDAGTKGKFRVDENRRLH